MNKEAALVVFSGGQDSTTCLFWAKREFKKVYALSFLYGQKHRKEVDLAREIARKAGVEFEVMDVSLIGKLGRNSLTDTGMAMDEEKPADSFPNTFVPGRNLFFLSIAAVYAREKGIPVVNVPTYGTASVSQFSIALLLEICHHIGHHSESVHAGNWANNADWCYWDYPLIELEGKTIGIIGFGRIGQAEGRIAKALGMNVLAYDLFPNDSGREIAEYVGLDELYACADVITLHCNLTPENTGMINKESIAKMKDGVILINNARGQLIDEQDVADALNCGKIAAAGLDVVYTEPIRADNPLLKAKNCIITPHISWAPKESRQRIMDATAENIRAFLAGAPVNEVNP